MGWTLFCIFCALFKKLGQVLSSQKRLLLKGAQNKSLYSPSPLGLGKSVLWSTSNTPHGSAGCVLSIHQQWTGWVWLKNRRGWMRTGIRMGRDLGLLCSSSSCGPQQHQFTQFYVSAKESNTNSTASFCTSLPETNSGRKQGEECRLPNWKLGKEMLQFMRELFPFL